MNAAPVDRPRLPYRYEFQPHEIEEIRNCNSAHGFAVVKGLLGSGQVQELKDEILRVLNPRNDLNPGGARQSLNFVEVAPVSWKLLEHGPFLRICRGLLDGEELTLHRTAAIIRAPGAKQVDWHSDMPMYPDPPMSANQVLNRFKVPNGIWFYLNGSHPSRGGLAVIEDSLSRGWKGPKGFVLTEDGNSFYRQGEAPGRYSKMDVPGIVPLFTDPGDLIIFADRTFHAAFPHGGDQLRLSCAVVFRRRSDPLRAPWDLPESARRFIDALPPHLKHFVDGYTGIVPDWKPEEVPVAECARL